MELVLDCVIHYIHDIDDLNSVSLVSTRYRDIHSLTRKSVTVHVDYLPDPSRLSRRFPNLESLTLESFKYYIPVTPWIGEIVAKFKSLKSLCIRNMVVSASDLKRLAKALGGSLTSLEIRGCRLFSEDGLADIAKDCIELRSLSLQKNHIVGDSRDFIGGSTRGEWLHELALHNTVMESLNFSAPFGTYDMIIDVTLLAKKCSNSLVSLNIVSRPINDFREVFNHAKKLDHFGIGSISRPSDYSSVRFPSSIRGLHLQGFLGVASSPFLLPYLNQLRELNIEYADHEPNNLCLLIQRCPMLEVLVTQIRGRDEVLQVIGQSCKKLRKLEYFGYVTQMGLIALAQGCPNLDYISVNISDISNEALECVGTHLKNLRDFRFQLVTKYNLRDSPLDNGVRYMLMGCSKLEKLHIDLYLGGLTDVGLRYIGEYGHNLRHLSLGYTGESDAGLVELSKGCRKLRKLKINGCPFSQQAIATSVFNNNHSVSYIGVVRHTRPYLVLTRPMVSAEVLTKQYLKLAEKLHRLALQLVADGSDARSVKITCTSSRATDDIDTTLVRNMVANGIRNEERDTLAWSYEKPLEIIVRIADVKSRFATAVSESGDIKLQGRVKYGVPHLTKVGDFEVDTSVDGHILLCRLIPIDLPDVINPVTRILVEENVNINSMSVGRPAPRKLTVMVIGVDEKPSDEVYEIPAVEEFVFLTL